MNKLLATLIVGLFASAAFCTAGAVDGAGATAAAGAADAAGAAAAGGV